ncbi:hypothetical protein D1872_98320 [compost metagenome]
MSFKGKLTTLQSEFKTKTQYEVIEKLIQSHTDFQKYKQEQNQEKLRIEKMVLEIGEEYKIKFAEFKNDLGLEKNSSVLEFLFHHYENSPKLDKSTFALYRSLIR